MTNRNGRGRPNSPAYVTSWGETINGVYRGKDDKLRIIGRARPAFNLTNERRAVLKIKRTLAELQGDGAEPKFGAEILAMTDAERQDWLSRGAMKRDELDAEGIAGMITAAVQAERQRIADLIQTNPEQAAIELGIEHLAHYPETPTKPQFKLTELAEFFCDNRRNKNGQPVSAGWKKSVRMAWGPTIGDNPNQSDKRKRKRRNVKNAFCDIIQVRNIRNIKQKHIIAYRDAVTNEYTEQEWSPSWLNTRYKAVKAVISFAYSEVDELEKSEYHRVLDLCEKKLKEIPTEDNPSPITPEHFRALLEVAPVREKAVLLLGLNCLMHGGEAAQTLKEDICWEDGTLRARRLKNRKARIAVLWPRTVKAIKAYLKESGNGSEYLFLVGSGKAMSGEYLRQQIVKLRNEAGIPKYVTFEGLRDAGYEIAEEIDSERAAWIAGHGTGMKDKYVLRMPDKPRIKKCCRAVEKHFFGR